MQFCALWTARQFSSGSRKLKNAFGRKMPPSEHSPLWKDFMTGLSTVLADFAKHLCINEAVIINN